MTALDLELTSGWLARDATTLAPTLSRYFGIVAVSGEGSWLVDVDGRRWLDLTSGIGVTNTGHCHPQVVAAIVAQARAAVEAIEPGRAATEQLRAIGLDPLVGSNVQLLTYSDIALRFPANVAPDRLDPGLRQCLGPSTTAWVYTLRTFGESISFGRLAR